MNSSTNNHDSIEQLIYQEGIRINTVDFYQDLDILLILLNSGAVIKEPLSRYPVLKNAAYNELINYQLTGKGTGIYWPDLDEDLSLKGFLKNSLYDLITNQKVA